MNDENNLDSVDPWKRLRYFLGKWKGTGSRNPGESQVEREYRFVLNEQFIQISDRSVYEP